MNPAQKLLQKIQEELDDNAIIVVEGPNDKKALQQLGLRGNIEQLSKNSLSETATKIVEKGFKKIIILTDFDDTGEQYAEKLKNFFLNEGITPDLEYRKKLKRLLGVKYFEDLAVCYEQKEGENKWEKLTSTQSSTWSTES